MAYAFQPFDIVRVGPFKLMSDGESNFHQEDVPYSINGQIVKGLSPSHSSKQHGISEGIRVINKFGKKVLLNQPHVGSPLRDVIIQEKNRVFVINQKAAEVWIVRVVAAITVIFVTYIALKVTRLV